MIKKYLINNIAKVLGMSVEGLKYYESQKLVTPHRAENGYRHYSHADVARLSSCKMFTSCGLTNKQVYDFINSTDLEDKSTILEDNYNFVEKRIVLYEEALKVIKHRQQIVENYERLYNCFEIIERESLYIVSVDEEKRIKEDKTDIEGIVTTLYEHMPLVENITFMTLPINDKINPVLAFRMSIATAQMLNLNNSTYSVRKDAGKYLYTIQKIPRDQSNFPFEKNINEYVTKNKLNIQFPMEITFITSIEEEGKLYDIYEYYIELM